MERRVSAYWFTALAIFYLLDQGLTIQSNFIEVVFADSYTSISEKTSLFNKKFHQCSKDTECNFVVKNVQTNEFKTYKSEKDLPNVKQGLQIWRRENHPGLH